MAEGPVVHWYAQRLNNVLKGRNADIEFSWKKLKHLEDELRGTIIRNVEPHGKQFRIHLGDDRVLFIHLMMWGSWGIFKKDEAWDRPKARARVIIRTESHVAVVFSAPVIMVMTREELDTEFKWGHLGPDPLRDDYSRASARQGLLGHPDREIGEALVDQQVIAGLGNVLRIEILFRAGVHPRRLVKDISDTELDTILHLSEELPRLWLSEMTMKKSWINLYQRRGKPCPACGTPIDYFRQNDRITFVCPTCQT